MLPPAEGPTSSESGRASQSGRADLSGLSDLSDLADLADQARPGRTAVFTIISKNYLHYARTLHQSLAQTNPDWEQWVLLADRVDGHFDPAKEDFRLIALDELSIPELPKFCFRYSILELNTAAKPWGFRWLFAQGYERVVYLDPDICVYGPLTQIVTAWESGALAVLTPHLTRRLPSDGHRPGEHDILVAGAYNLGFLALARHAELEGLLSYWCEKSLTEFSVDLKAGLFTDQRWMDLVPGLFSDVRILKHPGYNVAYWNLPTRQVHEAGGQLSVDGEPLVFFHFSGLNPDHPEDLSRHQDRYRLGELGAVEALVKRYCEALIRNGYERARKLPYAFGFLSDGTPIPQELRRLYQLSDELAQLAGDDPFALDIATLNSCKDGGSPPISWIMRAVYSIRPDLQQAFPDPAGRSRVAFSDWFFANAAREHSLDAAFILAAPARQRRIQRWRKRAQQVQQLRSLPMPRWEVLTSAAAKGVAAWRAGRLPLSSPRKLMQLFHHHALEQAQLGFLGAAAHAEAPASKLRAPASTSRRTSSPSPAPLPGVTLIGYVQDPTGVGESARACAQALKTVGVPFALRDARTPGLPQERFPINLLHVNADQTPVVYRQLGPKLFDDRYSIGIWHWELDELPDEYLASFEFLDELWAPSEFILRCLSAKSPIPVVHMPHAVSAKASPAASRSAFGLPADVFLFLVMYDMLSVQERKNPFGAIEAFARAFPVPGDARLVIKLSHGSSRPAELAQLRERVAKIPGVIILDRILERQEVYDLQAVCDAFVSLHRSEGWGLNLSESMLLGKPVIATAYSGNLDFMNRQNSCLVDYRLVPLQTDFGPYRSGNHWAEPDLDQAASYMRLLFEDAAQRKQLGERAAHTIATDYSPLAAGLRYQRRLRQIERFR